MAAMRTATASEGAVEWQGLSTWYRVVGTSADSPRLPVVICHGGPGLTHDYLEPVAELSRSGRACVLYDQVGNGRSTHRPDAPPDFWTVELFIQELENLVAHLDIAAGYHVIGHSWGGMLALELALRHPPGLRSVVITSAFASSATYCAEVGALLRELPSGVQATIARHQADATTTSPEYQEAVRVFYRRHVYRGVGVPDELRRTLAAMAADPTVYLAMNGPSEFSLTGSLREWDVSDRLAEIDVPALLVSGRHDEVTPAAVEPLHRGLPRAEWVLFERSSHLPHLEEPDRYQQVVGEYLDRVERAG